MDGGFEDLSAAQSGGGENRTSADEKNGNALVGAQRDANPLP
jgi:hypothetical protein